MEVMPDECKQCEKESTAQGKSDCMCWMWKQGGLAAASRRLQEASGCGDIMSGVPQEPPCEERDMGQQEEAQNVCNLRNAIHNGSFKGQDLFEAMLDRVGPSERPEAMGSRVDRLRLLGNGVVPATAARAWEVLRGRLV